MSSQNTFTSTSTPVPVIVPYQNSLLVHVVSNETLITLLNQLSSVPLLATLKLDIELTLHACKIIETIIALGSTKVDKKIIVMTALQTIFPDLTAEENTLLQKQVDFLYTNNLINVLEQEVYSKFQRFRNVINSCFVTK